MRGFRVIGVLDVKGGLAVHAVAGKRESYKPIKSVLTSRPDPLEIARAYRDALGLKEVYIADLDRISGSGENLGVVERICRLNGLTVMCDAGVRTPGEVKELIKRGVDKVIVATETMNGVNVLKEAVSAFGPERVVASLDLYGWRVLSRSRDLRGLKPAEAVKLLEKAGVREILVIDLSLVGTMKGPPVNELKKLAKKVKADLIAGGGVRNVNDILEIAEAGVKGVLVATALHAGAITREHLLALKGMERGEVVEIRYTYEEPAVTMCGLLLVRLRGGKEGAIELLKLIKRGKEEGNALISVLIGEETLSLRVPLTPEGLREEALRLASRMGSVIKHAEWGQ